MHKYYSQRHQTQEMRKFSFLIKQATFKINMKATFGVQDHSNEWRVADRSTNMWQRKVRNAAWERKNAN